MPWAASPYRLTIAIRPIHHSNVRSLTFHMVLLKRGSIQYPWLMVNQTASNSMLGEYLHPGPCLTSLSGRMYVGEGRGVLRPDEGALHINCVLSFDLRTKGFLRAYVIHTMHRSILHARFAILNTSRNRQTNDEQTVGRMPTAGGTVSPQQSNDTTLAEGKRMSGGSKLTVISWLLT